MAARYWVGGTGTWSSTNTTNWSATSGGTGGASVPTSADTPQFDSLSGTGVVTFTNTGVTVGATTINNTGIELSLGAAFATSNIFAVTAGTFTTNNYNFTGTSLASNSTSTRTINLGSSTVLLAASGALVINFGTTTGLTFNAGTSQINLTSASAPQISVATIAGSGVTFYNLSFIGTGAISYTLAGQPCTFNNLSFNGRTSFGITVVAFQSNYTINGTLTFFAGSNAAMRTVVQSNLVGVPRTLTCAAVASPTDIDFRDITIAGAAAPVSGTRMGDCKGNSGITFGAAKTVYFRGTGNVNWGATSSWSFTSGGTADIAAFPLAQDTAIFPAALYPAATATIAINANYNIGTIDMSLRTTNTMTLATSILVPSIYGNWINGTGTSLTGTGTLAFAGRTSQTITSAGKTFTQIFVLNSPAGTVTQTDALSCNRSNVNSFQVAQGTWDLAGYNLTLSGSVSTLNISGDGTRAFAIGSGTLTLAGGGVNAWNADISTNLTVTGTGIISLTSASGKLFAGGGIQTYPTINQGGTGTLTVTGSNKFANITNTVISSVLFTGGTTNEFGAFNLNGAAGTLLTLGSTNTTQVTLKKPTAWNVGANSVNGGNNTGLSFIAGDNDYLSISYVIGVVTSAAASDIYYGATNVTTVYYGSTPVMAIYYGSTQVF